MVGYFPLVILALSFGAATFFAGSFPFIVLAVSFDLSTLLFALPLPTLVGLASSTATFAKRTCGQLSESDISEERLNLHKIFVHDQYPNS